METTTFIDTRKKNGHSFQTEITVERTPRTEPLPEGRWLDTIGRDNITAVYNVRVSQRSIFSSGPEGSAYVENYIEVETPHGKGCVIQFVDYNEMSAFIPKSGKALITGCWKKYGWYRGHAIAWMKAHKLNVNTRSRVDHTCCARIYDEAVGGTKYRP